MTTPEALSYSGRVWIAEVEARPPIETQSFSSLIGRGMERMWQHSPGTVQPVFCAFLTLEIDGCFGSGHI